MNPNPRIQKHCDKALHSRPSRREYKPDVDCCVWREKINALLEKKKKKPKPKKKKKDDDEPPCCRKKDQILDKQRKISACCKKKKKKKIEKEKKQAAKKENCRDIQHRIYWCVKPSLFVRDQLMSGRHVLCMLDDLETVDYCKLKAQRKICDENPCMSSDCLPLKKGKKCEPPEESKESSIDDRNCCELITGKSRKCIYKKFTRTSKKPTEPRDPCDCFRYNFSRCSLDTVVDMGDFNLTEEEIEKIEKNPKKPKYSDSEDLHWTPTASTVNDLAKDTMSDSLEDYTIANEPSLEQDN